GINLTIKNYRCFESPVHFSLRRGFTGLLGVNNSGKSSLLRSFFELRSIFQMLGSGSSDAQALFSGMKMAFQLPEHIMDYEELFCDKNKRDLELLVTFDVPSPREQLVSVEAEITMYRADMTWSANVYLDKARFDSSREAKVKSELIMFGDTQLYS